MGALSDWVANNGGNQYTYGALFAVPGIAAVAIGLSIGGLAGIAVAIVGVALILLGISAMLGYDPLVI